MKSFIFLLALCAIAYGNEIQDNNQEAEARGLSTDWVSNAWNSITSIPNGFANLFNQKDSFNAYNEIEIEIFQSSKENSVKYSWKNRTNIVINAKLPTVIFIHGFLGGNMHELMREAYFDNGKPAEINLIRINWASGATHYRYKVAAMRTKDVGKYVADIIFSLTDEIKNPIKLESITLVGHSLGAQCAGFAGRALMTERKKTLPVIIGLDPARPAFEVPTFGSDLPLVPEDWKKFVSPGLLDKNSATKVLIVHTNAAGFGYSTNYGHDDLHFTTNDMKACNDASYRNEVITYLYGGEFVKGGSKFIEGIQNMIINEGAKVTNLANSQYADVCHHGYANIFFKDAVMKSRTDETLPPYSNLYDLLVSFYQRMKAMK